MAATGEVSGAGDKVIIVTGASDGIGAAAARELKAQCAHVVIVGRSPEKTERVAKQLGVPFYVADFAKFSDVRRLAGQLKNDFPHIDVLANNAGGVMAGRSLTVDGNEQTVQVNHLSPFLLTNLLLGTLIASRATVINTASSANRFAGKLDLGDMKIEHGYSNFSTYGKTKLMNILFTRELHARYSTSGISTAAFHPGIVRTNFSVESGGVLSFMYKTFVKYLLISPEKGADTLVWLAASEPGKDWVPGEYYAKRKISKADAQAYDPELARELWEKSVAITGISGM